MKVIQELLCHGPSNFFGGDGFLFIFTLDWILVPHYVKSRLNFHSPRLR